MRRLRLEAGVMFKSEEKQQLAFISFGFFALTGLTFLLTKFM